MMRVVGLVTRLLIAVSGIAIALLPTALVIGWFVAGPRAFVVSEVAELLRALQPYFVAVVVAGGLLLFRGQVESLLARIEEASFAGARARFAALPAQIESARAEQAALPPPTPPGLPEVMPAANEPPPPGAAPEPGATVAPEASAQPPLKPEHVPAASRLALEGSLRAAQPRLASAAASLASSAGEVSALADRVTRALTITAGSLGIPRHERRTTEDLIESLRRRGVLAPATVENLRQLYELRDRLAYSPPSRTTPAEASAAAYLAASLLQLIEAIPVPRYTAIGRVELLDQFGQRLGDPHGVVIRTTSPDMLVQSEAVFPTQQDYDIGARVSWEWDTSQVVGPCFYKTSDGATVKAFDRAAYFVGQLLTT